MKKNNFKKIKGYIEGYYGRLLTWSERARLLDVLKRNKMNFYFYCPKEDLCHRYEWKKNYTDKWMEQFKIFLTKAKQKNIKIICGISPGLDFDFKKLLLGNYSETMLLRKKCLKFIQQGADGVAVMFDDIPFDSKKNILLKEEGLAHARLVNLIYSKFEVPIFTVPRIYSDELIKENPYYLKGFFKELNSNINFFYTGKYIVSSKFSSTLKLIKQKAEEGKIIYWDNFYANDYCPKRLIIGPWKNIHLINKSMINGTGLIKTDEVILEIVNKTGKQKNKFLIWKNILKSHDVPKYFFNICSNFLSPNFSYEEKIQNFTYNPNIYIFIDHLLWKWKSELSREWYSYLLNFKHDLQILNKELSVNRILKTQTSPLQKALLERNFKNE